MPRGMGRSIFVMHDFLTNSKILVQMELLIAFLIGLGVFNSPEEASTYDAAQIEELRIEYNQDLINAYDEEYTSIYGTDETEVY